MTAWSGPNVAATDCPTTGLTTFERVRRPDVLYAGMMEYDGDLHIPKHYLVEPPEIGDGGLRVSVYVTRPQHVRFSVWRGEEAQAAISLDPHESARLARFLQSATRHRHPSLVSRVLARL